MSSELLAPPAGAASRRQRVVDYPEGDGKPMAETDPLEKLRGKGSSTSSKHD